MGRRKIPQTLEEIRAEKSYYEKKRKQEENRMKTLQNAMKGEERRNRTRRLCTEAGMIEHLIPEVKMMDDQTKSKL